MSKKRKYINTVDKLAIFSGDTAFSKPICVGTPFVDSGSWERYQALMEKVFERRYFTNDGPLVRKLEKKIAEVHNVKCCSALCNGTIAQILLLKALGISGEIILPSFTFIATAHSCLWQNLTPVFCDICDDTLMIDVSKAEGLITSDTSAVIGVNLFGNICNTSGLGDLCQRYGLKLILDSAHAFCCSSNDIMVGNFGDGEFISFHATKFFGTFEGGAILTNNTALDNEIKSLRNFGFRGYDDVGALGINGKMCESAAAMGLASLPEIQKRIDHLLKVRDSYCRNLEGIDGISVVPIVQKGSSNYQYMVVMVEEGEFGVSRDILCEVLWKENVLARKYFSPGCHKMEPYATQFPEVAERLPVTNASAMKILCLPTNLEDPERDTRKIAEIMAIVKKKSNKVRECLKSNQLK